MRAPSKIKQDMRRTMQVRVSRPIYAYFETWRQNNRCGERDDVIEQLMYNATKEPLKPTRFYRLKQLIKGV